MPKVLTLPKIGVSMTEATIVRWLVKEGDFVDADQPVLEAETEKAAQEIPSTVSGVLARILAKPGDTVQCHEPIAVFVESGEVLSEGFSPSSVKREEESAARVPVSAMVRGSMPRSGELPAGGEGGEARVKISPLAKKLAKEMNIDYTKIGPSKPGGRIEREDVLSYAAGMKAMEEEVLRQVPGAAAEGGETVWEEASGELVPLQGVRKVIAQRMLESARNTARAALFMSADATKLAAHREKLNERGATVGYTAMLVMTAAKALREFPNMNSRMEGNGIRVLRDINIGVAVDTEHGLTVPVIHNADRKDISTINRELAEKAERARARKSAREDISGGTFTITNLGMYGVESFVPIINPPECAILAVGAIIRQPVALAEGTSIAVRPVCSLTLVFDHRIVDGAPAARFLQRVKEIIEDPERYIE